jgi:hypothetical protein
LDLTILKDGWAQLGAVGLLLGFMVWWIRTSRADNAADRKSWGDLLSEERKRNGENFERVYTLAQTMERTAAELTQAVKGPRP